MVVQVDKFQKEVIKLINDKSKGAPDRQEKTHCTICGKTHVGGAAKCWKKKGDPSAADRQQTRQQWALKLTGSVFSNSLEDEENQDESSEDTDEPEGTSARASRDKKNKRF